MTGGRRLRVSMVHGPGAPERDGVSDYVARLCAALSEVGVDVDPVPVRPSARGRWLAATMAAAAEVRRLRPDVAHVQFSPSAYRFCPFPGLLPALLPTGLPLVTTVHEYGDWAVPGWVPDGAWRPVEAVRAWDRETGRLIPASSALIVTNPHHAWLVNRRTGRRPVEIPLAPNVTDHGGQMGARQRVRRRLGLAADAFLLVFFGFVHPVKGLRYVLEALPALRSERPDLHLAVVGGFTSQALPEAQARAFRAELESLAVAYEVREAVTFTGHVPAADASELLHAADAAVLPFTAGVTRKSGALLAALAHGVPTAVSVPDDPDPALRDGETVAVIARRRDAGAVVASLRPLLHDVALRRRLGSGGRDVVADCSWPRVAARHHRLYELVCARRGR
ncbi:Glycogen synthase [Micromonospora sp. MH33]|uniref:glycosyltransferase family 4 protein n=1 Tax=Micromonospora sp. MH33 TaxID=1945509 RepID=UPI000D2C8810|nr:glycosyltransferase family 4 protein [Micromonospora sp. MH33]PSK64075.1 Glycogen synthase [Micromonospora sp. MH33]